MVKDQAVRLSLGTMMLLLVSCSSLPPAPPEASPVEDIRASLDSHDGQKVLVKGFMTVGPENNSLWPSREAADHLDTHGCISLSMPDEIYNKRLNGSYVVLAGTLHKFAPNVIVLNTCGAAVIQLDNLPTPFTWDGA
jgi:hypothetical protein